TCNDDSDCKNGVKCEPKGEKKFCSCKSGLIGDKCQIVVDCTADGTYKGCEASGGKCSYDGDKAICTCSGNKKLDEKDKICKLLTGVVLNTMCRKVMVQLRTLVLANRNETKG
ncbi:hypothetical protein AVEN_179683-1, partial [Araneus ventricosus]